jgi:hypothetical protein
LLTGIGIPKGWSFNLMDRLRNVRQLPPRAFLPHP